MELQLLQSPSPSLLPLLEVTVERGLVFFRLGGGGEWGRGGGEGEGRVCVREEVSEQRGCGGGGRGGGGEWAEGVGIT